MANLVICLKNSYPLYFEMGENSEVNFVKIIWPSGIEQKITKSDIPRNGSLTVVEQ